MLHLLFDSAATHLAQLHIANIEKIVKFVRLSDIETYKL